MVILSLEKVPTMDASGLVALRSTLEKLAERGCLAILMGLQKQPAKLLDRAGIHPQARRLAICPDMNQALKIATQHLTL